jgi:hypothetical protein
MTFPLVVGTLAAFVAVTLAAALRRAPTRTRCPECGKATLPVQPEAWLLKRIPDVRLRWCRACNWQGWGRNGAEWVPGHPAAHDSGFHWGDDRFPEDFGFRFARQPEQEAPAAPPDHPSGFRFSAPPEKPGKAHPSGFAWSGSGPTDDGADAPAGFQWGPTGSEGGARFAWGQREGRKGPPPGFNWKDVG